MKGDIRLILCDIDGTLVTTDRRLTPATKAAIEKLHRHGMYFGIASGRSIDQQLMHQAENWGFDFQFEVLIGMNGSELWDGLQHRRYDYYKLKREWIKEIVELMQPFDLNPFLYYHDKMLCLRVDESTLNSSRKNRTEILVAEDVSQLYAEENAKIMFRIPEEWMEQIENYVNQHPSPYYKAFKTQTTMLEFADRRVSKAVALKNFCANHGLSTDQVAAFGDMTNDNEMIRCSGWGVCMSNGSEETKALSDDVTERSNDEDGFAHYLDEHLFQPRGW